GRTDSGIESGGARGVAPMQIDGIVEASMRGGLVGGGERVVVRGARREDVALYRVFLAAVSPEDLRLRFFADIAELSAEEMDKLAHLDSHNIAFVALDKDTGQMLGLVRLKEGLDEKTAEFAILVVWLLEY